MRLLFCFGCVLFSVLRAEPGAVDSREIDQPAGAAAATVGKSVQHDGQNFVLASRSSAKGVETDEYTVAGETLGAWTQLVTVQRLTVAVNTTNEAFVAFFRQKVAADGASFEVLDGTKAASVFVVRFPKSEQNEEQVMIGLAFRDSAQPELLNIVQYALKPARCPVPDATARLQSWRDRFLAQARNLAATSS